MSSSMDPPKSGNIRQLPELLREIQKVEHRRVEGAPLDPKLALLRAWQAQRLARTYDDLLNNPRYAPSCRFFLNDIYAARDFSQRNHDLEQLHANLRRFVPESMVQGLTLTVGLHYLSEDLDRRLLDALVNQVGITDSISVKQYAEAYRLCDNYAERAKQIELIYEIGKMVDSLVSLPLSSTVLKLAKGPAKKAGWDDLMDFMERGFKAFKHMHGSKFFLALVRKRETGILDRIYAHHPDPFGFDLDEET